MRTVEATTPISNVTAVVDLTPALPPPPPPPTKVITLRPGVNWTDTRGER
jgi:hypothetical protein